MIHPYSKRAFTGVLLLWVWVARGSPAYAFSYPEHIVLTRRAITAVQVSEGERLQRLLDDLQGYFDGAALSTSPDIVAEKFQVADLPGLAGDHAASPLHLVQRWLRAPSYGGSCQWRAMADALADIDVFDEQPSVCVGRPDNAPCNRTEFLATVRRYSDGERLVRSTADMDGALAAADCSYVCLAERGAGHFRLPGVPVREAATRVDESNAALTYTRWHSLALALAELSRERGAAGPRYRAVATVIELFSLHFLQDGVAAGHIVTPENVGNMTKLATHDRWNAAGITVTLPSATCERVLTQAGGFPRLRRHCLEPARPVHVRGDNAVAEKRVERDPDDVTDELVALVTQVSLEALLEHAWPHASDAQRTFGAFDESAALDATVAAFEPRSSGAGSASACEADWDCPARAHALAALIGAAMTEPAAMLALAMWPAAADPARTPSVERPGGGNLYVRLATGLERETSRTIGRGSVGVGAAWAASMKGVGVVLGADAVLAYAGERPGVGVHAAAVVNWLALGGLSFANEVGVTVAATPSAPTRVEGYICPVSYEWTSDRTSVHTGLLGGVTQMMGSERGWFVGVGVSATLHVERKRSGHVARGER